MECTQARPAREEEEEEELLLAACTSGFSGVYFEYVLKGSTVSLWMRNVQMAISSIVLALAGVLVQDGAAVRAGGFFQGYNPVVVGVIALQALGGLTVAVVVKYADNILKGFAASFSILTSTFIETVFFGFRPSFNFFAGAMLVNLSMWLYSRNPRKAQPSKRRAPV